MAEYARYNAYKDSGVPWLGEIPVGWEVKKLKFLCSIQKGSVPKQIKISDETKYPPYLSMDFLRTGSDPLRVYDTNVNCIDINELLLLWDGSNAGEFIKSRQGVLSSTVAHVSFNSSISKNYAFYACKAFENILKKTSIGMGIPHVDGTFLKNSFFTTPPLNTQNRIVTFLDTKVGEIEAAIEKKRRLIALLQEQKAILINNAVTKGLNPNAAMKDSGVDWIGDIPAHWEVKRVKYLFSEIDERSETGKEELLSVSHMTGVTPRSEKNIFMFMAADYAGSKLCKKGDLVFNIMWAWMGALGVSDRTGIVSPSYGVYRAKDTSTFNPWYLEKLLRSLPYVTEYNRRSTGLHSSRLRLYADMFFAMEIGFPSLEEQDIIEKEMKIKNKTFKELIKATEQEIKKLTEFKETLIAHAVTGKIKI